MPTKTKPKTSADTHEGKSSEGKSSEGKSSTAKRNPTHVSKNDHGSHTSIDHEEIRKWAEERGGEPACVRGTGDKKDAGVIRIDFPTGPEPSLQQITWDEWFEKFDHNKLALVYQEHTAAGEVSRFNKIVSRDTAVTGKK